MARKKMAVGGVQNILNNRRRYVFDENDGTDYGSNPEPTTRPRSKYLDEDFDGYLTDEESRPKGPVTIGTKTFASAFKQARTAGLDKFEWKGRVYNTQTADEVKRNTSKNTNKTNNKSAKKVSNSNNVSNNTKREKQGNNRTITGTPSGLRKRNKPIRSTKSNTSAKSSTPAKSNKNSQQGNNNMSNYVANIAYNAANLANNNLNKKYNNMNDYIAGIAYNAAHLADRNSNNPKSTKPSTNKTSTKKQKTTNNTSPKRVSYSVRTQPNNAKVKYVNGYKRVYSDDGESFSATPVNNMNDYAASVAYNAAHLTESDAYRQMQAYNAARRRKYQLKGRR